HAAPTKDLFASLLELASVTPQLKVDDPAVQARLQQGSGGTYLWVTNQTRDTRQVKVTIAAPAAHYTSGEDLWGKQGVAIEGTQVAVSVGGRDAAVIALRST